MQGLSVLLFILGVLFIYFGWKAESKPSKELYTALVALSKVKKDVARLEKGYQNLEEKIDHTQRFNEEIKEELGELRTSIETKLIDQINAVRERSSEEQPTALLAENYSGISSPTLYSSPIDNPVIANHAADNFAVNHHGTNPKAGSENNSSIYSPFNPYFVAKISADQEKPRTETNVYSIDWLREQGQQKRDGVKSGQQEKIKVSEKYTKVIDLKYKGLTVSQIAQELDISQDAVNMVLRTYQIGGQR